MLTYFSKDNIIPCPKVFCTYISAYCKENNGGVAQIKERKTLTTYNSIFHYCVIKNMVAFVSGSWSEPLNPWNVLSDRNACVIHGGA